MLKQHALSKPIKQSKRVRKHLPVYARACERLRVFVFGFLYLPVHISVFPWLPHSARSARLARRSGETKKKNKP